MGGLTSLRSMLVSLMTIYVLSVIGALMAAIPMILHVNPRSECILFASQEGYGHYACKSLRFPALSTHLKHRQIFGENGSCVFCYCSMCNGGVGQLDHGGGSHLSHFLVLGRVQTEVGTRKNRVSEHHVTTHT